MKEPKPHTAEEFNLLPLTVPLRTFCDWTGLDRNRVHRMAIDGQLGFVMSGSKRRYLRSEIGRLLNYERDSTAKPSPAQNTR